MNSFILFTIIAALVGLSTAQLKQNDFTVNYLDSSNENGYNFYASDEKSFRDEKWRFSANGPLFFIRKLGYRKPDSNQFDVVETKIDFTGTHVKNYVVDSKEQELQGLQEPIDEPEIMDRTAPKINAEDKAYQPTVSASDIKPQVLEASPIFTFQSTLPEVDLKPVEAKPIFTIKPPAKAKPIDATLDNSKPAKPVSIKDPTKPVKDTIVDSKPDLIANKPVKATKPPTKKPKPVKDTIVDSNPEVIANKPVKTTKAPTKKPKPVKDTIVDAKPDVVATKPVKATKAPTKKPNPIKDTIVDEKPDVVDTKPVKAKPDKPPTIKPPTKKPVKVKPAKPAKPAKPTKPVAADNGIKAPDQGPFPGLSFLWSLYRRPVVTVVGAFLNRPETGLQWIPFVANAPTLPAWPPKLPWERFPIVG